MNVEIFVSIFSHKSFESGFGYSFISTPKWEIQERMSKIRKLFGKKKYVVLHHIAKIDKRSLSNKSIALGKLLKI